MALKKLSEEHKKFNREKEYQLKRLRKQKDSAIDELIGKCEIINKEIKYWKERKFEEL